MTALHAPDVLARGRWWRADELDSMARAWRADVLERVGDGAPLIAAALDATPGSVALFVALTSLPSPVVLLPADARAWRTDPPVPSGVPLALTPALAHLAPIAERYGLVPIVLRDPAARPAAGAAVRALDGGGVVLFTSGSTGLPRPVFHTRSTLMTWVTARHAALGLSRGAGMLMEASPAHGQGLSYLVGAMVLGGPLGLLDPRDHRQALASLAHPAFGCWRASAHFADVLSRCALTGPPIVPAVCVLGTPIPRAVRDAFRERFGVPLRQAYSSTETGIVAADGGPPDDVRANTVGRPLAGVEIRIDDESTDEPAGRIWVRSPWLMAGYGFPPRVERPGAVDGWWPTRDRGRLGPDGRLTLAGRVDDAIRTRDNRIVDLAHVADHLRAIPEVAEALVIAFDTPAGPSFGAVVECAVTADAVRARLAETLPPWSWPRAIETVSALPRLPNGKPDRRACAALLGEGRA